MATDFYSVLGVDKGADHATIKKAYRKLASSLHPDKHPGDKAGEARFKTVNQAYQVLKDPQKRALYDEFGEQSLSEGFNVDQARAYQQWAGQRGAQQGQRSGPMPSGWEDILGGARQGPMDGAGGMGGMGDLIGELFGRGRKSGRGSPRSATVKGSDVESEIHIDFASAIHGATVALQLAPDPSSDPVQVRIPAGATEGSRVRIKGQGQPSPFGGPPGDLILLIHVGSHPVFRIQEDELHLDLPVSVSEAYLGAKVAVPTPAGEVAMRVPPGTQTGQMLRLKGKGITRSGKSPGNLYVHFAVMAPSSAAPEVKAAVEVLQKHEDPGIRNQVHL